MTAENVELVRRFFEDLNRGEVDALLARLTPQFEMVVPAGMGVEPRTYRGPEGFRRWLDSFSEIMEIRVESHDFIAVGDRVVAPHTLHAGGRETGIDTERTRFTRGTFVTARRRCWRYSRRSTKLWRQRDGADRHVPEQR